MAFPVAKTAAKKKAKKKKGFGGNLGQMMSKKAPPMMGMAEEVGEKAHGSGNLPPFLR